jgi:hypothetical protein
MEELAMAWRGWIRYGAPGVVLGVVLAWGMEGRGPSAQAQVQAPSSIPMPLPVDRGRTTAAAGATAQAAGTIALTTPMGNGSQMLFLVDTQARAFAAYRIDPSNPKGTVKLEAARKYQWDLQLDEYNNLEPNVAAIESTVRSLGHSKR